MIYRDFQDVKLSALGMSAMRLPVVDGDDSKIDEAAAFAMVDEAMARGVHYYATARGYHTGTSQLVSGKALARHPRGDGFPRVGQEGPADGGRPAPGQRLLRPLGPVRRGSRQPRRDHQGAAQQQGKQSLHNITSSANMVP